MQLSKRADLSTTYLMVHAQRTSSTVLSDTIGNRSTSTVGRSAVAVSVIQPRSSAIVNSISRNGNNGAPFML